MGWGGGEVRVGSVGKVMQTMGMARTTYETVLKARPEHRPVVVSRSGVPGIQAYAHATWSGDNSTTWKALEWGTKMTLSVGMSFGPGLYGHDIGGFAGAHYPGPELLVRWCQNGAWHTRFTVHSWKEVSTTLWMHDNVPGISDAIRAALAFRYRLAPTFYSLYVTDYQRHGWPVLKPLLWHHSVDPMTLQLDEEFLFGSYILVAPVTKKGARTRRVYLPAQANDGETSLQWCELDTGVWHVGKGEFVELDAPLERTPTLVRAGGVLVLGGACTRNIHDGVASRTALIFPAPTGASQGCFTLIEDDGVSNAHTGEGEYTELVVSFVANEAEVIVNWEVVHGGYELPYEVIWFELPRGDKRKLVVKTGKTERRNDNGQVGIVMYT
ncbi:glycosyl hydrolases family 31-domain-containing protein [Mycena sanguinolenta]|nr:glycosyl hydrolases family 31-domain-containing protein [Mycena sanguinolenta]